MGNIIWGANGNPIGYSGKHSFGFAVRDFKTNKGSEPVESFLSAMVMRILNLYRGDLTTCFQRMLSMLSAVPTFCRQDLTIRLEYAMVRVWCLWCLMVLTRRGMR